MCGFITNDLAGKDMGIEKCDACQDGYLIVKSKPEGKPFLGCTCYKADGSGCNRTISYEVYKRGFKAGYEEIDCSLLPHYERQCVDSFVPETRVRKKTERTDPTKRTQYVDYKDGFQVVADDEGNILTDCEFLDSLIVIREAEAKRRQIPLHLIVSNKGLVSLATYKPSSIEEWLSLPGLGKQSYVSFGRCYLQKKTDG